MDRSQATLLIAELGQRLGVSDMALSNGSCLLSLDSGAVVVSIRHDEPSGTFELMAGHDDVELSPARLAKALAANFCWRPVDGALFSLDPISRRLVLRRTCSGDGLDVAALMTLLDRFVKHAMAWTKILAETADEEGEEAAAQLEPRRLSMAQERA
jgi:hypothetical protein